MKLTAAAVVALLHQSSAFTPTPFTRSTYNRRSSSSPNTSARPAIIDPSILADVHHHADTLSNILSSIVVADGSTADLAEPIAAAADTVAATVAPAAPVAPAVVEAAVSSSTAVAPVAADAANAAAEAATTNNGWFGFLAGPLELVLQGIHGALTSVGLSENSWGVAIIILTSLIKLVTYPLTVQQLESTNKMQAVAPVVKEIQAKYASNPEVMNQKVAAVYQDNQINPLAGCFPAIVTIPVFIGLYRAVLNLAAQDKFDEPFLWLPNLEGPTYGADPSSGMSWINSGWVDGVPPLGWDDTLAFLTIPAILIVSQFLSLNLMATKDQEQPAFIKFLPFLIGYFSLNVPAALGIYWIANNIITTALTLQIRAGFKPVELTSSSSGGGAAVVDVQSTFTPAPIREKPSGFGASAWDEDEDGVKPITKTGPVDAEIVAEDAVAEEAVVASTQDNQGGSKKKNKKRGGKKKRKKN